MPDANVIRVKSISKSYGPKKALDSVSFEVFEKELVAVLGPNGAGKTTLIEILEGYKVPDEGEVKLLGKDPREFKNEELGLIGIMLQETAIEPFMRVEEVLNQRKRFLKQGYAVDEVLELVGLKDARKKFVTKLSGGQKRRLDFALAFMGLPHVLFLDEPTTGFDPEVRKATWELIQTLKNNGMTIILTTHYLQEAEALADKILILNEGKVVTFEEKTNLYAELKESYTIEVSLPKDAIFDILQSVNYSEQTGILKISTDDPTEVLYKLTHVAKEKNLKLKNLKVYSLGLEDLYFKLLNEENGKLN